MKPVMILAATVLPSGCNPVSSTGDDLTEGVVQVAYQATIDDAGSCQPQYEARTQMNTDGSPANEIDIIRGETRYFNPEGRQIGNIPLQMKIEDETISVLNEFIRCEDLKIEVTVEECVYEFNSQNSGCPEFQVNGKEGFADVVYLSADAN
jgi:hypothetical protein